ncbi:hypothetical protein BgiMline_015248 [Biomphalaria glabrata]|nr:putative G-protein coupled receptor [Biomphalaria glabrata]
MGRNDLSREQFQQFTLVNIVYLNTIVSLVGVAGNIVNLVVFVRQGFGDNINRSLFALAVADIGFLLIGLITSLCRNPEFANADISLNAEEFHDVIVPFVRGALSRIISSVTAFITFERCFCVLLPLKVKIILTAHVTDVALCLIFLSMGFTVVPFYLVESLGWKFDVLKNKTVLGRVHLPYTGPADINVTIFIHTCVQIISYSVIVIFTFLLLVKLKQQSEWRKKTTENLPKFSLGTNRKLNKTLALVSTMAVTYLVCYSPMIAYQIVYFFEPGFSMFGDLVNYFLVGISFSVLFESFNSSLSFFLYFSISAKYRKTFKTMFSFFTTQ